MADNNKRDEILAKVKAATAISNSHKKEYTFDIDINGYTGSFTVKHPSLMDTMSIGVKRAQLLNGASLQSLDVITDNITFYVATLSTVLIKAPEWFDLDVLDDYVLLSAVYKEYRDWNDTFRRRNESGSNTGSSETASDKGSVGNNEDVQDTDK